MPSDTYKRSIAKTVVYKALSVAVLALLSWVFTQDIIKMSLITVCYEVVAGAGYFIHERLWEQVKWGRKS